MRSVTPIRIAVIATATALVCTSAGTAAPQPSRTGADVTALDHSRLLLWPAGAPAFGSLPGGGPGTTVVVTDLGSGRHTIARIPGIAPGDFPVPLLPVHRWLVYNAGDGIVAIRGDLHGRQRLLGRATFFLPSAAGRIVLVDASRTKSTHVRVRTISVGRRTGSATIELPAWTGGVIEGTARGVLLLSKTGRLELWRRGRRPRSLGHLGQMLMGAGVAADPHVVVYASGCRDESATSGFPRVPVHYNACAALKIVDLATGARSSVPTPAGTLGWVPRGFGAEQAIAPGDRLVAAEAAVAPASHGRVRVFVVHLARDPTVTAVPGSIARLYAGTAWTTDGSWLLYQGPGERLHALDITTGATRGFRIRCCRYAAMVVTPI
jgi:hypothetical protein